MAECSAAHWESLMDTSKVDTMVVRMDTYWVDLKAAMKGTLRVVMLAPSLAVC